MMCVNWLLIKTEYINGNLSYRKLADKHNIPFSTLRDRAGKENWVAQKIDQQNIIGTKTAQKTADKIADDEAEIAAIKSRLRLKIYRRIENQIQPTKSSDGTDFRRLVQSYCDMLAADKIVPTEVNEELCGVVILPPTIPLEPPPDALESE